MKHTPDTTLTLLPSDRQSIPFTAFSRATAILLFLCVLSAMVPYKTQDNRFENSISIMSVGMFQSDLHQLPVIALMLHPISASSFKQTTLTDLLLGDSQNLS